MIHVKARFWAIAVLLAIIIAGVVTPAGALPLARTMASTTPAAQTLPAVTQHLPAPTVPLALGNAGTNLQNLGNGLCVSYAGNRAGRLGEVLNQSSCRVSRPWIVYFNADYSTLYFRPYWNSGLNVGENNRGQIIFIRASDAAHSRTGFYRVIRTGKTGHYAYWFGLAFYPNKQENQFDYWLAGGNGNQLLYMFTVPMGHLGYFRLPYCDTSCHPVRPAITSWPGR